MLKIIWRFFLTFFYIISEIQKRNIKYINLINCKMC